MMKYKTPHDPEGTAVYLKRGKYANGNPSLQLYDAVEHYPYATCTVNIPGLGSDEVAIKNYSENEGMLDFLVSEGIVDKPHREESSGYVTIPVCRFLL